MRDNACRLICLAFIFPPAEMVMISKICTPHTTILLFLVDIILQSSQIPGQFVLNVYGLLGENAGAIESLAEPSFKELGEAVLGWTPSAEAARIAQQLNDQAFEAIASPNHLYEAIVGAYQHVLSLGPSPLQGEPEAGEVSSHLLAKWVRRYYVDWAGWDPFRQGLLYSSLVSHVRQSKRPFPLDFHEGGSDTGDVDLERDAILSSRRASKLVDSQIERAHARNVTDGPRLLMIPDQRDSPASTPVVADLMQIRRLFSEVPNVHYALSLLATEHGDFEMAIVELYQFTARARHDTTTGSTARMLCWSLLAMGLIYLRFDWKEKGRQQLECAAEFAQFYQDNECFELASKWIRIARNQPVIGRGPFALKQKPEATRQPADITNSTTLLRTGSPSRPEGATTTTLILDPSRDQPENCVQDATLTMIHEMLKRTTPTECIKQIDNWLGGVPGGAEAFGNGLLIVERHILELEESVRSCDWESCLPLEAALERHIGHLPDYAAPKPFDQRPVDMERWRLAQRFSVLRGERYFRVHDMISADLDFSRVASFEHANYEKPDKWARIGDLTLFAACERLLICIMNLAWENALLYIPSLVLDQPARNEEDSSTEGNIEGKIAARPHYLLFHVICSLIKARYSRRAQDLTIELAPAKFISWLARVNDMQASARATLIYSEHITFDEGVVQAGLAAARTAGDVFLEFHLLRVLRERSRRARQSTLSDEEVALFDSLKERVLPPRLIS